MGQSETKCVLSNRLMLGGGELELNPIGTLVTWRMVTLELFPVRGVIVPASRGHCVVRILF